MGFLGLDTGNAPSGMRGKRFLAFVIDAFLVLLLAFLMYNVTGQPDFFGVQSMMDAAQAAGGKNAELTNAMFSAFNKAYGITLLIAFVYEVLTQLVLGGATIGKKICGLQIIPENKNRSKVMHGLLLCVRSALKMASIYLFQGFPFIICNLTIFTNAQCRTGFDMAIKSVTVDRRAEQSAE